MEIVCTAPTGFEAEGQVKIFDSNGALFYRHEKQGKFQFNLPRGRYTTTSEIKRLSAPLRYDFKAKRKREYFHFNLPKPSDLKVEFGDNPNKASIWPAENRILFDSSWKSFPRYVLTYLKYHELGHYLYRTEEYCDEFAQEAMLKEGYNKSQIDAAARVTLHRGHDRHKACTVNLQTAKRK